MPDRKEILITHTAVWKSLLEGPRSAEFGLDELAGQAIKIHHLLLDGVESSLLGERQIEEVRAEPRHVEPEPSSTSGYYTVRKVDDLPDKLRVRVAEQVGEGGWFTIWKAPRFGEAPTPAQLAGVKAGARITGTVSHDGGKYWKLTGLQVAGVQA